MAEIRKHDPATGNAIAQALRAAMGDTVRPLLPGEPERRVDPVAEDEPATSWVSLTFDPDSRSRQD